MQLLRCGHMLAYLYCTALHSLLTPTPPPLCTPTALAAVCAHQDLPLLAVIKRAAAAWGYVLQVGMFTSTSWS